jgi:hypothetical protein
MAEGVFDPAQQPAVLLVHRNELRGAQGNGLLDRRVRIVDDE